MRSEPYMARILHSSMGECQLGRPGRPSEGAGVLRALEQPKGALSEPYVLAPTGSQEPGQDFGPLDGSVKIT